MSQLIATAAADVGTAAAYALPALTSSTVTFPDVGRWQWLAAAPDDRLVAISDSALGRIGQIAYSDDHGATWTQITDVGPIPGTGDTSVGQVGGLCWDPNRSAWWALIAPSSHQEQMGLYKSMDGTTWTLINVDPTLEAHFGGRGLTTLGTALLVGAFRTDIVPAKFCLCTDPDEGTFVELPGIGPTLDLTYYSVRLNTWMRGTGETAMACTIGGLIRVTEEGSTFIPATQTGQTWHTVIPDGAGSWLALGRGVFAFGYATSNDDGLTWTVGDAAGLSEVGTGYASLDGFYDGTIYWAGVGKVIAGAPRAGVLQYDPDTDTFTEQMTSGDLYAAVAGDPQPASFEIPLYTIKRERHMITMEDFLVTIMRERKSLSFDDELTILERERALFTMSEDMPLLKRERKLIHLLETQNVGFENAITPPTRPTPNEILPPTPSPSRRPTPLDPWEHEGQHR